MEILSSINRSCNGVSGVNKLYLFPYVKYNRSQIVLNGNIIIDFPETEIFEFETVGDVDFNENTNEDDGGKYYEVSLSFRTKVFDEAIKLRNKDIRAIVLDNNGNYRLLGNYNGLTCESVRKTTGTSKADFNGLEFTFSGKEQREAFFIKDIEVITGVPLPTENLVTYFKLNGNTNDATGTVTPTSNGITYVNNIYSGASNGSAYLDSNLDNIIVPDNDVYTFSEDVGGGIIEDIPFTIHGSFQPSNLGVIDTGNYAKYILHKRGLSGEIDPTNQEWQISTSNSELSPKLRLVVYDDTNGGFKIIDGSTILSNGTNYHFTVKYDGTNYKMFLNGTEETITENIIGNYVSMKNTSSQFKIGSNSWFKNLGLQRYFNTIGIWKGVALTEDQIEYVRGVEESGNYII